MFGTFRFLLAILVVIQHMTNPSFKFADAAVLNFFMLSGYVMTIMIRNNYGKLGKSTLYFYADRFLRIYPQYLFFFLIILIGDSFLYYNVFFMSGQPTFWKIMANLTIVPMNYHWIIPGLSFYQLMPSAWSLGLEEQFYWIFPFIVLLPWVERFSAVFSFSIFTIALLNILNHELFAYRFLPGVIFIFLLGKNLAEYNVRKSEESFWTMSLLYTATLSLTVWLWLFRPDILATTFNTEILLAILVGFPILAILSRLPRKKWDDFLGNCSYGVFLGHVMARHLVMYFRLYEIKPFDNPYIIVGTIVLISVAFGYLGYYLVEKPTLRFRYALRKRHTRAIGQT